MIGLIDRRRFLATSTASVSVSLLAPRFAAATGRNRVAFDAVIVDQRIAGRQAVEHLARVSGTRLISIRGDLPKRWFDSLRDTLREHATPIAGLTSDLDSEVMRAFARDVGYSQQQRIEISVDAATGRRSVRHFSSAAPATAPKNALEQLVDAYVNTPMPAHERPGPAQLAAWTIAPIRD